MTDKILLNQKALTSGTESRVSASVFHLIYAAFRRFQHIFNKNPVSFCRIIDENMRHSSDESAILQDR